MLNDTPVACQTRGPTDPQGDRWHGEAVTDEVSPRPGASVSLSPTAPFLPTAEEMGERTPAETAFLHFLSALYRLSMQSCAPTQSAFSYPLSFRRLCQHSFPLPLPLAVAEISPLPNYSPQIYHTPCPTGTPTFAALRRQRRDLIIANASSAPDPTLAQHQRQRRKRYKRSLNRQQCHPPHQFREISTANFA